MKHLGRHRTRPAGAGRLALTIEAGEVVCPRVGIVDLERCFRCRDYDGLVEGPVERLVCAAATGPDLVTRFGILPD